MKKIIIDADPGVDDFIAITLAIKSKHFDILGITTVEGNCSLENATKNAFKVLDICNRNDIDVYEGLNNSDLNTSNATYIHGNNGLGEVEYEPINRQKSKVSAIDFLINSVKENPNEITVIALGPLTNIAECIKRDPDFTKNVKELVVMGSTAKEGNIVPYAEFNFYKDPRSAQIVMQADFKDVSIISWDVAINAPLLPKYEVILKNSQNSLLRFIYDISRIASERDGLEFGGAVISDPITIAYLIDENVCKMKPATVNVVSEGDEAGKSIVKFVPSSNIKYSCEIDSSYFYELLFKTII